MIFLPKQIARVVAPSINIIVIISPFNNIIINIVSTIIIAIFTIIIGVMVFSGPPA